MTTMTECEVHERLAALVLGVHRRNGGSLERLELGARLLDPSLGLDSLDLAELMAGIEKEFGVSPFERTAPRTWGDVAATIVAEGAARAGGPG